MGNSTPCKIVPPKNIILKLCIRDYVGHITRHANCGFNRYSGDFSPNRWIVTTLWLFWLSCPVLSLPFFSILRPVRTAGPIFALYGSKDVFACKNGPWGSNDGLGEVCLQNPPKWAWINNFEPKRQNTCSRWKKMWSNPPMDNPHIAIEILSKCTKMGRFLQ